jgi:hypothetical protein
MTDATTTPALGGGDTATPLYYFAIGAMMNPISVFNRGIQPVSSEPGELLHHKLGFFTSLGFAEALPTEKNVSFHGVIHHVTEADMAALDKIEQNYERKIATARLYNGTMRQVSVYIRQAEDIEKARSEPKSIPKERYIEIMIAGARHYGVDGNYIQFLQNLERTPRPSPETYQTFDAPPLNGSTLTFEDVFQRDGSGGQPLLMTMGNKVIYVDLERGSKDFDDFRGSLTSISQIGELFMAKVEYDPKYGLPSRLSEVSAEQSAYCEHNLCIYLTMRGMREKWKTIGRVRPQVRVAALTE